MPLSIFNNTDFKIVAAVRVDGKIEAFTNEANSCLFSIKDKKNEDYALLKDIMIEDMED